jgi:hypothetical protein
MPRTQSASAIIERWQRHQTASEHMTSLNRSCAAPSLYESRRDRLLGILRSNDGRLTYVIFAADGIEIMNQTIASIKEVLFNAASIKDGVSGDSVRYFVDGQRVLQGKFVKLHITDDAGPPPQYEADVYIGFDAKANDYIAH